MKRRRSIVGRSTSDGKPVVLVSIATYASRANESLLDRRVGPSRIAGGLAPPFLGDHNVVAARHFRTSGLEQSDALLDPIDVARAVKRKPPIVVLCKPRLNGVTEGGREADIAESDPRSTCTGAQPEKIIAVVGPPLQCWEGVALAHLVARHAHTLVRNDEACSVGDRLLKLSQRAHDQDEPNVRDDPEHG